MLMDRIAMTDWLHMTHPEKLDIIRRLQVLRTDAIYESKKIKVRTKSADANIAKRSRTPKSDMEKLASAVAKLSPAQKQAIAMRFKMLNGG